MMSRLAALLMTVTLGAGAASAQDVSLGKGAILRSLDKVSGQVEDLEIGNGGYVELGRLRIELQECRYPAGNPSGDAYAFVTIHEPDVTEPVFSGWMIATAPALSALDHSRYDIWALRCKTS